MYVLFVIYYFDLILHFLFFLFFFFFFNDTATTEIYTLSLHDALPDPARPAGHEDRGAVEPHRLRGACPRAWHRDTAGWDASRSLAAAVTVLVGLRLHVVSGGRGRSRPVSGSGTGSRPGGTVRQRLGR